MIKNMGKIEQKRGKMSKGCSWKGGIIGKGGMSPKTIKPISLILIIVLLLACIIAPVSYLVYTSSGDLIWTNMTEGTNLGARLSAAVLSMDFNNPAENPLNLGYQNGSLYQSGTYIKDGSVYNNFGTSSGLTKQYWWNGNTNGSSVINGSLQFDGVDDYISISNYISLFSGFNQVPLMSSNTAPSGVASESLQRTSYPAFNAFDKSIITNPAVIDGATGWFQYQFTTNKTIINYKITTGGIAAGNRRPKNWTMLGSTDNSTWTVLDTQVNQFAGGDGTSSYIISNSSSYSYYRMNVTENYGDTLMGILEWGMFDSNESSTISLWYKNTTTSSWTHGVWLPNGTNYTNGVIGNPSQKPLYLDYYLTQMVLGRTINSTSYFNGSIDDVIIWGRALNATEINQTYQEGLAGRTIDMDTNPVDSRVFPTEGRVMYFSMNTNDTTTLTESWNGFNATCSGTTCPNWNTGGFANTGMYNFDGSLTMRYNISVANSNITGNKTWGAWVKPKQYTAATASVISRSIATGGYTPVSQYELILSSGGTHTCRMNNGSSDGTGEQFISEKTSTALNSWKRVDCTYNADTGNLSVYVNGIYQSSIVRFGMNANTTSNTNLYVGGQAGLGRSSINGSIDEITIFNKTLNASEVAGLYDATRKKLHLQLDELSGTSASSIGENGSATIGILTNYPAINPTAPTWNATGGVNGSGAYVFSGTGGDSPQDGKIINLPLISTKTVDYSFSIWLNPISNGTLDVMPLCNGYCGVTGWWLRWRDGKFNFVVTGTSPSVSDGITGTLNNWQHVVGVVAPNGTNYLYYNGNLVRTFSGITTTPTLYTTIGGTNYRTPPSNGFNGSIDNVQIFNRALSAEEVLSLYNGTSANKTIKYSTTQGDFTSGVFYNSTTTYWNVTLATADTINRSGIVNIDNSINISNPNLVSYWTLDGNYLDTKGRNNGTGVANITNGLNNVSGISSSAIKFDGVDDYITMGNVTTYDFNTTYSYGGWINSGTYTSFGACTGGRGPIFGNQQWGWYSAIGGTTALQIGCAQYYSYSSGFASGAYNISANQWINYYCVNNGTALNLYVNGALVKSGVANTTEYYDPTDMPEMGKNKCGATTYYYNGSLDEMVVYNTSLSSSQVSQLYKSGLSSHANTNVTLQTRTANTYNTTDPSLVGFWSFANETNITLLDETGRNNGTYMNGAKSNLSSGVVGNGGYFDGVNDIINITNVNFGLNGKTSISFGAWENSRLSGVAQIILSKHIFWSADQTYYTYYSLITAGNLPYCSVMNPTGVMSPSWTSTIPLSANSGWHHIYCVYNKTYVNASDMVLYVDGVSVPTTYAVNNYAAGFVLNETLSEPAMFGARQAATMGGYFNGSIDEVRIYNRSLSADEVLNLYNLGSYHITDWTNWTNPQTCYDNETQVQTENGWKLFSQLNKTDKVATLNPKTNEIEYKLPSEYQVYDAPEFMYKIITEKGEMIVSPDHKVYSATGAGKDYSKLVVGIFMIVIGLAGLWKILRFGGKNE